MTDRKQTLEDHISKGWLETLVDGIFAIAMTLLIPGINPPHPQESDATIVLPGIIEGLVPQVFLFIVSLLVLALFRLGHHRQFQLVLGVISPRIFA